MSTLVFHFIEPVLYHSANLNETGDWQELLQKSDWVIDAVGILFPSKSKGTTYEKNSIQPAKIIIDTIVNSENQCLFISANDGPSLIILIIIAYLIYPKIVPLLKKSK